MSSANDAAVARGVLPVLGHAGVRWWPFMRNERAGAGLHLERWATCPCRTGRVGRHGDPPRGDVMLGDLTPPSRPSTSFGTSNLSAHSPLRRRRPPDRPGRRSEPPSTHGTFRPGASHVDRPVRWRHPSPVVLLPADMRAADVSSAAGTRGAITHLARQIRRGAAPCVWCLALACTDQEKNHRSRF